jgi:hypothetical protein
MALTMSEARYKQIKAGVEAQRAKAKVAEAEAIMSEPGAMTFGTVDELFEHLDTLVPPEAPSPRSRRKRR